MLSSLKYYEEPVFCDKNILSEEDYKRKLISIYLLNSMHETAFFIDNLNQNSDEMYNEIFERESAKLENTFTTIEIEQILAKSLRLKYVIEYIQCRPTDYFEDYSLRVEQSKEYDETKEFANKLIRTKFKKKTLKQLKELANKRVKKEANESSEKSEKPKNIFFQLFKK